MKKIGLYCLAAFSCVSFSLSVADSATDYEINAMKPGFFREPSSLTVNGANVTGQTLTVASASTTISGQVLIGSAGAANAFVRADRQGGGFTGTQADSNGNYTLAVNSGFWKVYAVAEQYAETEFASNPIDVTGGSVTGKDITLSGTVSLDPPKSKSITPASGGTLEDDVAGVKLTIPANALGSSTSAGNLQAKETNNVRGTASSTPLGGKAQEIKATDSDGNPITTLNDSVTVEMTYTKAELAAIASATDAAIDTNTETDALQMAYWDETTANWVTIPSTITYKDSSDQVITDTTTIDTAAEFDTNVAKVTVSAATDHFSLYAPVVATNASAPSTPTGLAVATASSSQLNLSWTVVSGATSYNIYRSPTSDGTFARLGSEPTVSSGATVAYSDSTGLSAGTVYYYKIAALNASGESAASSAVSENTAVAGSGGGGAVTPPAATVTTPTTTNGTVAATVAGGGETTLTTSGGATAKVSLPANAVSAETSVAVTSVTNAAAVSGGGEAPAGKTMAASYSLSATTSGTAVTSFSQAVTVTFTYTADQITGLDETSLKIYRWTGTEWEALTTTVDVATNTLVATTTNFSYFAIMGETPATGEVAGDTTPVVDTTDTTSTDTTKPISEMTVPELEALLQTLIAQVAALQAELALLLGDTPASCSGITFSRGLAVGATGSDVKCLQALLNQSVDTQVASSGVGSLGNETSYYGSLTATAVGKFQTKKGVAASSADGGYQYVGPKTRTQLNSLLGQ